MTLWYELRTLTGRPLSRTHSLGDGKWRWITDNIKGDAECHYEDIDIEDADDGEFITVKGERYAVVLTDFSQTPEHKQAMDEREAITATAAARRQIDKLEAEVAYLKHEVDVWRDRCDSLNEDFDRTIAEFNRTYREAAE